MTKLIVNRNFLTFFSRKADIKFLIFNKWLYNNSKYLGEQYATKSTKNSSQALFGEISSETMLILIVLPDGHGDIIHKNHGSKTSINWKQKAWNKIDEIYTRCIESEREYFGTTTSLSFFTQFKTQTCILLLKFLILEMCILLLVVGCLKLFKLFHFEYSM